MRSMKMAALAVAMTLMFSGLALARDHDHDKDKNDHWDKHGDRDRHHDRDHDCNVITTRPRPRQGSLDDGNATTDWWEREHRRNDGYYGGGQIYNRYPRGYPGGYGYPGRWLSAIPAAAMAILVPCMDAAAAAETEATTSAIRTAATWRATRHVAEQALQSESAQRVSETGRTATTVRSATRTTTGRNTATAMPRAMNRIIAEEEAGDTRKQLGN